MGIDLDTLKVWGATGALVLTLLRIGIALYNLAKARGERQLFTVEAGIDASGKMSAVVASQVDESAKINSVDVVDYPGKLWRAVQFALGIPVTRSIEIIPSRWERKLPVDLFGRSVETLIGRLNEPDRQAIHRQLRLTIAGRVVFVPLLATKGAIVGPNDTVVRRDSADASGGLTPP